MEKYTPQSQKKNKINSIDELPDALLISIVSFLPTRESARTSILARRWRNLWLHTTTLNFDDSNTLHEFTRQKLIEARQSYNQTERDVSWFVALANNMLQTERAAFVRGINAALNSHLSQTLDEFRVTFNLDISNSADIHRWIASALAKKVKRLELDFARIRSCFIKSHYVKLYEFPNAVQNFETLVSLSLTGVHVNEGVVDFFLRNCPFLEQVCVKDCSGFQSLKGECQLRSLTVDECRDSVKLEIHSPNLASLTFFATINRPSSVSLDIKGVSSLVRLSLGAKSVDTPKLLSNWLYQISGSLANLQMLTLRTPTFGQGDDEELMRFPDLPNLRTLVISNTSRYLWVCDGSLVCFNPLLNAAPLLHKLVVKFPSYVRRGVARHRYQGIRHRNLKELVVEGLSSKDAIVADQLALFVLENSSLEKMIIDGKVVTGIGLHLLKISSFAAIMFFDILKDI